MGITELGMLIVVVLIVVCAWKMCTACCVQCCAVGSRKAASKIMVAQIKPQTKASKTDDYFIALRIIDMSDTHVPSDYFANVIKMAICLLLFYN